MPYPDALLTNARLHRTVRAWLAGLSIASALMAVGGAAAQAQTQPRPAVEAAPQAVPGFWDPRRRPDRPDMSRLTVIRFLTETDYPPFNFTGADGNPAGFNVDLARALCDEIKVTCTIQMRRFETLVDAITSNRGDAIIASMAVTPAVARPARFHRSLLPRAGAFRVAARRRDAGGPPRISRGQEGRRHRRLLARGLSEGDVHRRRDASPIRTTMRCGWRCGAARSISSSATRSRWRSGSTAPIPANAAPSRAAPLSRAAISAKASASPCARATICCGQSLNWALFRVWEKGRYTDLWLRYFSVSPF